MTFKLFHRRNATNFNDAVDKNSFYMVNPRILFWNSHPIHMSRPYSGTASGEGELGDDGLKSTEYNMTLVDINPMAGVDSQSQSTTWPCGMESGAERKAKHDINMTHIITVPCRYNAVNFYTKIHKRHPTSERYGMFFVDPTSDWCSASVLAIIYVISYNTGPCYNGTQLSIILSYGSSVWRCSC